MQYLLINIGDGYYYSVCVCVYRYAYMLSVYVQICVCIQILQNFTSNISPTSLRKEFALSFGI